MARTGAIKSHRGFDFELKRIQITTIVMMERTSRATHALPNPVSRNTVDNGSRSRTPSSVPLMFATAKTNQKPPLRMRHWP